MASKTYFPDEFPCPICGEVREMRSSKKDKPYLVCDPCGVQIFIRGKLGISRLVEMRSNSKLWERITSSTILDTCNLLKLSRRIDLINSEIAKIDSDMPLLGSKKLESKKEAYLRGWKLSRMSTGKRWRMAMLIFPKMGRRCSHATSYGGNAFAL